MKMRWFLIVLLCCHILLLQNAEAVTYKYTDKDGMLCFADDIQSIPEQYRSQVALIEGAQKEQPAPGTGPASGATVTAEQTASQAPAVPSPVFPASASLHGARAASKPLSTRLAISLVVALALFVSALLIARHPAISHEKLYLISLRTGAIVLFLAYLAVAHGRDVLTMARMAGKVVDDVQQRSAQRGQKAAEGLKKLDAMFQEMQEAEEMMKKEEEQAAGKSEP